VSASRAAAWHSRIAVFACGSHIFVSKIENIQIDSDLEGMDREKIDLRKLDPAIYAPYNYYRLGEKLGDCGEWAQHIPCNG